jgi:hypothetical protein
LLLNEQVFDEGVQVTLPELVQLPKIYPGAGVAVRVIVPLKLA